MRLPYTISILGGASGTAHGGDGVGESQTFFGDGVFGHVGL